MKQKLVKMVCIIECTENAKNAVEAQELAQERLDSFRESVLPHREYGLTIAHLTVADLQELLFETSSRAPTDWANVVETVSTEKE
jgi:hypothetical protein